MFQSPAVRLVGFVFLFLAASLQLYSSFQEQMVFTDRTAGLNPESIRSPRILTNEAQKKHLFEADFTAAETMLQRALILNPLYVPAWLNLVTLYNDQGEKERAGKIFEYTRSLLTNINRWRWDAALVAYQIGKTEVLPDELRYIIGHIPGKQRRDSLQLAFSLWPNAGELLDKAGLENINYLFNHAVRTKQPDHALYFWEVIGQQNIAWQEKELLACIDMLLGNGRVREAAVLWRDHFNPGSLIYNGTFASPFLQRAFGWRKGKATGFAVRIDPASGDSTENALHLLFKGWENLNFHHVYQIVPVEGGMHYVLDAEFRSSKLTTDQRPYLEVYSYKCSSMREYSAMVAAEQDWQRSSVFFGVSVDCSAVLVRVRRDESRNLDNKISGQLWMRNITITPVNSPPIPPRH